MLDEGKCSILLLLHINSAFDTVVYIIQFIIWDILAAKVKPWSTFLVTWGTGNSVLRIGSISSYSDTFRRGVPYGSVLGPILFYIYTIDLSTLLKNLNIEFRNAYDTQFYLTNADITDIHDNVED